jgi:hypothetical protein
VDLAVPHRCMTAALTAEAFGRAHNERAVRRKRCSRARLREGGCNMRHAACNRRQAAQHMPARGRRRRWAPRRSARRRRRFCGRSPPRKPEAAELIRCKAEPKSVSHVRRAGPRSSEAPAPPPHRHSHRHGYTHARAPEKHRNTADTDTDADANTHTPARPIAHSLHTTLAPSIAHARVSLSCCRHIRCPPACPPPREIGRCSGADMH